MMRVSRGAVLVGALLLPSLPGCSPTCHMEPTYEDKCPVVREQKLLELHTASQTVRLEKIFWGDSVVEFMHDSRLYGLDFVDVAQSGQNVFCAKGEMDYVIAMEPETVLIYIGGNDADGQSWYGPQEAASHYAEILDRFLENRITPIVHLVHEASTSRNREYVQTFNRLVAEAARERSLSVVPDLKALSFDESRDLRRRAPETRRLLAVGEAHQAGIALALRT